MSALYLSLSIDGCILEATQGLTARLNPLTIVSYDVNVGDIADLSVSEERERLRAPLNTLACAWMVDRAAGRKPLSWALAERLSETCAGILVPSFAPGARKVHTNLVLWHWNDDPSRSVKVFDPEGRLSTDRPG